MKKPEWFELTKDDQPITRVARRKAPVIVFIVIGIIVSLFFIVPPNSGNTPPDTQPVVDVTPTQEPVAVKSPSEIPKIKNPSIGTMPTGDNEDQEEGDDEDDEEDED